MVDCINGSNSSLPLAPQFDHEIFVLVKNIYNIKYVNKNDVRQDCFSLFPHFVFPSPKFLFFLTSSLSLLNILAPKKLSLMINNQKFLSNSVMAFFS